MSKILDWKILFDKYGNFESFTAEHGKDTYEIKPRIEVFEYLDNNDFTENEELVFDIVVNNTIKNNIRIDIEEAFNEAHRLAFNSK